MELQKNLLTLGEQAEKWQMQFSESKCKMMHSGTKTSVCADRVWSGSD